MICMLMFLITCVEIKIIKQEYKGANFFTPIFYYVMIEEGNIITSLSLRGHGCLPCYARPGLLILYRQC